MTETLPYLNSYLNSLNAKTNLKVGSQWKTYDVGRIFLPNKILTIVEISGSTIYYNYYSFDDLYSKPISTFFTQIEQGLIKLVND